MRVNRDLLIFNDPLVYGVQGRSPPFRSVLTFLECISEMLSRLRFYGEYEEAQISITECQLVGDTINASDALAIDTACVITRRFPQRHVLSAEICNIGDNAVCLYVRDHLPFRARACARTVCALLLRRFAPYGLSWPRELRAKLARLVWTSRECEEWDDEL